MRETKSGNTLLNTRQAHAPSRRRTAATTLNWQRCTALDTSSVTTTKRRQLTTSAAAAAAVQSNHRGRRAILKVVTVVHDGDATTALGGHVGNTATNAHSNH